MPASFLGPSLASFEIRSVCLCSRESGRQTDGQTARERERVREREHIFE